MIGLTGIRARRALGVVSALAMIAAAGAAPAQEQDSVFRSLAKSTGLATDVDTPPDFILKSRPAVDPPPMSVFATPDEPRSAVKSPDDLKKMDAELEGAGKKHDVLRGAYPPSAKAAMEQEAARKAKMKKKPAPTPAKAAF